MKLNSNFTPKLEDKINITLTIGELFVLMVAYGNATDNEILQTINANFSLELYNSTKEYLREIDNGQQSNNLYKNMQNILKKFGIEAE